MHLNGKILAPRIECNNLTLRTNIKQLAHQTICLSYSVEIHEKMIVVLSKGTISTDWIHPPLCR
ncbi:IS1 family transposase [Aeromonas jandaei]|uniref:IS1 family transposase n=1 Tax=Aeromonas jandaei TaxID=650 RepID=UPI003BA0575C